MLIAAAFSDLDMALLMVPTVGLMALAMFGADERLATSRRSSKARHRGFCELTPEGQLLVIDPDGKPWKTDSQRCARGVPAPAGHLSGDAGPGSK